MVACDERLLVALRDELRHEMCLHRELLRLAEDKHRRIVDGRIDEFSRLLEEERMCMARAGELRDKRDMLLAHLAREAAVPLSELRLARLLEHVDEPLRSELGDLQTDLRTVLTRLREVNDRNMLLIRQSLGFLRDVMDVVLGDTRPQGYSQSGGDERGERPAGGLLDCEA